MALAHQAAAARHGWTAGQGSGRGSRDEVANRARHIQLTKIVGALCHRHGRLRVPPLPGKQVPHLRGTQDGKDGRSGPESKWQRLGRGCSATLAWQKPLRARPKLQHPPLHGALVSTAPALQHPA